MVVVRVGAVKSISSGPVIIFMLGREFVWFTLTLQYRPCLPVEYVAEDLGYVVQAQNALDLPWCWLYSWVNQIFSCANPVCSGLIASMCFYKGEKHSFWETFFVWFSIVQRYLGQIGAGLAVLDRVGMYVLRGTIASSIL